jgi:hypothetical protein
MIIIIIISRQPVSEYSNFTPDANKSSFFANNSIGSGAVSIIASHETVPFLKTQFSYERHVRHVRHIRQTKISK